MDLVIVVAILVLTGLIGLGFVLLNRTIKKLAEPKPAPGEHQASALQTTGRVHEREIEIARQEERLRIKQAALEDSEAALNSKKAELVALESQLLERQRQLEHAHEDTLNELARIAKLTPEDAKAHLEERLQGSVEEAVSQNVKHAELRAEQCAAERAKAMILNIVEKSGVKYVAESTTDLVQLESDDVKGKIVGREGRNIRAFEQITGVDLLVDETPGAVVISSFDPVRREVARQTLQSLIADGRIQPARIEELHEKAKLDVGLLMDSAAQEAAAESGVDGLNIAILRALGQLRFRTSYGQNVLSHSVEVARIAGSIAEELGFNAATSRRAALLHDIGKGLGTDYEGPHALAGMAFLKDNGEQEPVLNAVGAHHYEIAPLYPESKLVIIADALSAARPGARRESLEGHTKRLADLEKLAGSFPGVERSYAVQSGREIRLIVKPQDLDDLGALRLASEVARKIESDLNYPGQIKVTVIRETRASDIAK